MSKNLNNNGAEVESDATRIRKQHNRNQEAARWKSGSGTMGIRKQHDGNQKAARWKSESSTMGISKQHDGNQKAARWESGSSTMGIRKQHNRNQEAARWELDAEIGCGKRKLKTAELERGGIWRRFLVKVDRFG